MRRLALVLFAAVACGPVVGHTQSLALAFHNGDSYKYTVRSTATESVDAGVTTIPIHFELSGRETITVRSVDAGGTADLSISLSDLTMKASANGVTNTTTGTPLPAIEMRVASDGRILSINGNALGGSPFSLFSGMGGIFMSAVLPDGGVRPGDTWSKEYDQPNTMGSGSFHVTTRSKYLRDESVKGVNAAVVETTSKTSVKITVDISKLFAGSGSSQVMPGPAAYPLTITGTSWSDVTTWFDPAGHRVLKSHVTGTIDATMTMSMKAPAGTTMPALTGPYSIKGTQTLTLDPA